MVTKHICYVAGQGVQSYFFISFLFFINPLVLVVGFVTGFSGGFGVLLIIPCVIGTAVIATYVRGPNIIGVDG